MPSKTNKELRPVAVFLNEEEFAELTRMAKEANRSRPRQLRYIFLQRLGNEKLKRADA